MPRENISYHEIACDYALRGRQREIMNRFLKETQNRIRQLDPQKDAEQIEALQYLVSAGNVFSERVDYLSGRIEEGDNVREDKDISNINGQNLEDRIRICLEKGYLDKENSGQYTKMFLEHWEQDAAAFQLGKDYVDSGTRDIDIEEEEDDLSDLGEDVEEYVAPFKDETINERDERDIKDLTDSYDDADSELLDEKATISSDYINPYKDFIDRHNEEMNKPGLKRNEIKTHLIFSIYAMREAERYNKAPEGKKPPILDGISLINGSVKFLEKNEKTFSHLFNKHSVKELKDMNPEEQLKAFKKSRFECKYTVPEEKRAEFNETTREVLADLKKTGKGTVAGFIPRLWNNKRYDKAVEAIRKAAEPNAKPEDIYRSVKTVQDYLKDKKGARTRDFGNVRVNSMLKYLSQGMAPEEFKKYLDEFNAERGVKDDPLNPDHLTPEDFMKDTTFTKEIDTFKEAATENKFLSNRDLAKLAAVYKNSVLGIDKDGKATYEDEPINQRKLKDDTELMLKDRNFKYLVNNVEKKDLLADIQNGGQKYFANIAKGAATAREEKQLNAANQMNKA